MIIGLEKVTASVLQASTKLKAVAKHGAGVDNIDVKTATDKKVVVLSARDQRRCGGRSDDRPLPFPGSKYPLG